MITFLIALALLVIGHFTYCTGMISVRMGGGSVSEIVGKYLGTGMKQVMRVF